MEAMQRQIDDLSEKMSQTNQQTTQILAMLQDQKRATD